MNDKQEHPEWYTGDYMNERHPDAFKDWVKKTPAEDKYPAAMQGFRQECLKCHGYGGWNLRLNQYMNREQHIRHFRASCNNCNGWGYTKAEDHIHEWDNGRVVGNCLRNYTCSICGKVEQIDSSG